METARVLNDYAEAWSAGDMGRVLGVYHDDFILHYFGESPLAGTHRGKAEALPVLAEATRRSNRRLEEIEDVLIGSDLGALIVRERLGAGSEERPLRRVLLYRVREGRLHECWLFDEDQRFVDSLWSKV